MENKKLLKKRWEKPELKKIRMDRTHGGPADPTLIETTALATGNYAS